jgi:phenylalanyl-tRNA synthetase beta chain
MAGVTFHKKRIEALVGRKLANDQWNDRISHLGVGFDSVTNDELHLEVTPNRPDLLSEQGLARALKSFLGVRKGLLNYTAAKSSHEVHIDASVAKVRPFTACAVVTGLKFDDAAIKNIIQFQEKLHVTFCRNRKKAAIGIYPLENIAWPIRYLAKRPDEIKFQPLEAGKQMTARQILEHHPAGKAFAHLLEKADRYPLFVDGNDRILSMPPIINSEETGRVTPKTKDVFVECSGFDLRVLQHLLNIIVTSLVDAGGKAHHVTLKYGTKKVVTPDFTPTAHTLDLAYANKTLGTSFKEADVKRLLEKMGYGSKGSQILAPCYRIDILHARDIIEDLAIAAGYEHIDASIPNVATIAQESPRFLFAQRVAELLVGLGLLETNTFHLTSAHAQTTAMLSEHAQLVELANSLNAEYNALRAAMLPSLMDVLKNNKHHDYPQRLFGIGTVFAHDKNEETGVAEKHQLALVTSHPKADYTEIRQVLEYMLDRLGVSFTIKESAHSGFIPGRAADVLVGKQVLARVGEVHPQVLRNWELEQPVSAIELDMDALFALIKK